VVRANDYVAVAHAVQDGWEVVSRLARDEHAVLLQDIPTRPGPPALSEAQLHVIEGVGDPLRAHFEEAPAQVRVVGWDALHEQVMEGAYYRQLESGKACV